jgi:hypothetical protein
MPENLQKATRSKTFGQRAKGAAFVFLLICFLLGLGWLFIWFLASQWSSPGSYEEFVLGQDFPPREKLAVADGRVVNMGYNSNRGFSYVKPKIEYAVGGKTFGVTTLKSYSPDLFPYKEGDGAPVLYLPAQPERAWQQWEYDQLIIEYKAARRAPPIRRVKTFYNYLAVGIAALSAALLTLNLFFPFVRYFVKER